MFHPSINQKHALCILSGILTGLTHHPLSIGFIAWFSLIPYLYSIQSLLTYKRIIIAGFIFGFSYSITQIFWLSMNIGTSPLIAKITMVSASLYLTLFHILFAVVFFRIKKVSPWMGAWSMAIIWVAIEYLKSLGLLGFPWVSLGNSQWEYLYPIQLAEYTGIFGVSFWVILINISILQLIKFKEKKYFILHILIFITPFLLGKYLLSNLPESTDKMNITLIQPNIHLNEKWGRGPIKNLNHIIETSKIFINDSTELLIWPETAVTTFLKVDSKTETLIREFLQEYQFNLLTGFPEIVKTGNEKKYYNSIGQLNNDGVINSYQKIHPVPMAEHIPFSSVFPSLKKINLGQANWDLGENHTLFNTNDKNYSGVICYESTYPSLVRKFVKKGAEFIAVLVNDGWYETPPEPQQHASQSIFRAIENRRVVVRSANTGISLIVDLSGEILEETKLNEKIGISSTIPLYEELTFYSKYGDVFSWIMLIITFGLLGIKFKRTEIV
jgi:apolipoprotein N-acyltransferase